MKFSTRAQYGLRAMVNLARNYDKPSYSLHQVAEEECISLAYLERLMALLKKAKLVKSKRGMKGGYRLSKSPAKIRVGEVIRTVEGPIAPVECVAQGKDYKFCRLEKTCSSKIVWQRLRDKMVGVLNSITLYDLIKK